MTTDTRQTLLAVTRQVDIVELADIEKLYLLLHARLQLLQALAEPAAHMSGAAPTAQQTVGLLVNAGMYDSAFNIASIFKLSLTGIFEGIASRSACCMKRLVAISVLV